MATIWTSGSIARAAGFCVETIRSLERRGVLKPRRDAIGRRIFTDADLAALLRYRETRQGQMRKHPWPPRSTVSRAVGARADPVD